MVCIPCPFKYHYNLLILSLSPGDVFMLQRICWPAASVAKSWKPVVKVVVVSTHLSVDCPAMFHAPTSTNRTNRLKPQSIANTTMISTVTALLLIGLDARLRLHPSAMSPLYHTPRHSIPYALDHLALHPAPAEPRPALVHARLTETTKSWSATPTLALLAP